MRPELPAGSREYLLDGAESLTELIRTATERFEAWGARRVVPTAFEPLAALPDPEHAFVFTDRRDGRLLGLRQDLTPQIRRIVETELRHLAPPYRLYYVERRWLDHDDALGLPRERLQAGVEWIGAGEAAERELLTLALDLARLWTGRPPLLLLGDARCGDRLRAAWRPRDAERAATALRRRDLSAWRRWGDPRWPDLPLVVLEPGAPLDELPEPLRPLAADLEALAAALSLPTGTEVRIDLLLEPTAPYYTGLCFGIASGIVGDPWLRGGRYDARFHGELEAVGFAADLDLLLDAMRSGELPHFRRPRALWLGPGRPPEAPVRWLPRLPGVVDPVAWARSHSLDGVVRPVEDGYRWLDPATGEERPWSPDASEEER